ncbi:MAG: IclR family transcriptional regulator [Oscillospiraceae bacterium]|jgi:DNA-binding IclR family transcriptional regulator|nr:IclR family transcriptional regulator [Oscillospiraceae bacterium]
MEEVAAKPERIAQIQSVERAIWILKCFEGKEELSLSDISRKLLLHKSTAFGLVATLTAYRLLEQDKSSGKYRLGIELFRLGSRVSPDLREIVAPFLAELVNICGETVNLVIPDGNCVVYVEKKESPHSMRIATSLGHREPLYRTSGGKAILARMPLNEAEGILSRTMFERATGNTIMSAEEVLRELEEIRARGFAVDNQELEYGLVCIGVAIVDSMGKPAGAISVSGPSSRMSPESRIAISRHLIKTGEEISRRL